MSIMASIFVGIIMVMVLTLSGVYLLRERLLELIARCVGVEEYGAEVLRWGECKRLHVRLRKGPLQSLKLESARLRLLPARHSSSSSGSGAGIAGSGRGGSDGLGALGVLRLLVVLVRLTLAACIGSSWADAGSRGPLAVVRLQGLEVTVRHKQKPSSGSRKTPQNVIKGSFSGPGSGGPVSPRSGRLAGVAAGDGDASRGQSRRESYDGSSSDACIGVEGGAPVGGAAANEGGTGGGRRKGGRRVPRPVVLPAAVLRLLPLVRMEVRDVAIRADGPPAEQAGIAPGVFSPSQTPRQVGPSLPPWLARLATLELSASVLQSDEPEPATRSPHEGPAAGSAAGAATVTAVRQPALQGADALGNGGGSNDDYQGVGEAQGPHAFASAGHVSGAAAVAAVADGGGGGKGAVGVATDRADRTVGHKVAATLRLTGLEVGVGHVTDGSVVAEAAAAAGGAAAGAAIAPVPFQLAGRCAGVTVKATFGGRRRSEAPAGQMRALAVDGKEVQVDCRTGTHAAVQHTAGTSPYVAAAAIAAAAAAGDIPPTSDSPIAAALAAVFAVLSRRPKRTKARKGRCGDAERERLGVSGIGAVGEPSFRKRTRPEGGWEVEGSGVSRQGRGGGGGGGGDGLGRGVSSGVGAGGGRAAGGEIDGLADKAGAWIDCFAALLPDEVHLKLGGLRASAVAATAAAETTAAEPATQAGSGARASPPPTANVESTAAAVQVLFGPSSVQVVTATTAASGGGGSDSGPGAVQPSSGAAGTGAGVTSRLPPLLHLTVRLGQTWVAATAGDGDSGHTPAGTPTPPPLSFAIQHVGLTASVTRSSANAAGAIAVGNLYNSGDATLDRLRYCIDLGIELPASVLQLRPQLLLLPQATTTAVGEVGGTGAKHPQLLLHSCYNAAVRGLDLKASCSFCATVAVPPPSELSSSSLAALGAAEQQQAAPSGAGASPSAQQAPTVGAAAASGSITLGPTSGSGVGVEDAHTGALPGRSPSVPAPFSTVVPSLLDVRRQLELEPVATEGDSTSVAYAPGRLLDGEGVAAFAVDLIASGSASGQASAVRRGGPGLSSGEATRTSGLLRSPAATPASVGAADASASVGAFDRGSPSVPVPVPAGAPATGEPSLARVSPEYIGKLPDVPRPGAATATPPSTPSRPGIAAAADAANLPSADCGSNSGFPRSGPAEAPPPASGAGAGGETAPRSAGQASRPVTPAGRPPPPPAGAAAAASDVAALPPMASLELVVQGIELYVSTAPSSTEASVSAAEDAAPGPSPSGNPAASGRCDLLVLKRTTLTVASGMGATMPSAGMAAGAQGASSSAGESPLSGCTALDASVALGRLDVTLDPKRLQPLLVFLGHAKGAATTARRAAAVSTAIRGISNPGDGKTPAASTSAKVIGGLVLPTVGTAPFQFPADLFGPAAGASTPLASPSNRTSGDRGSSRGASDGGSDVAETTATGGGGGSRGGGLGSGAALSMCRSRRRGGMGSLLRRFVFLRGLTIECAAGIRTAVVTAVPLDPAFSVLPTETRCVRTTLEVTLGSVTAALWPGGLAHGGATAAPSVSELTVTEVVFVVHPTASNTGLRNEGQQVLRVDRLKALSSSLSSSSSSGPAPVAAPAAEVAAKVPGTNARTGGEDGGGRQGPGPGESPRLLRVEFVRTRGFVDIDLALAGLAAVQAAADAAAAAVVAAAAGSTGSALEGQRSASLGSLPGPGTAAAPGAVGRKESKSRPGKASKGPRALEIRFTDVEVGVALGAAEVVTFSAVEARGSTGLRAGLAEGLAVRVNGRRLLDIEHVAVSPSEPLQPAPRPGALGAAASRAGDESIFSTTTVAAGTSRGSPPAATAPPPQPQPTAHRRSRSSRTVSRDSGELESIGEELLRVGQPPPPPAAAAAAAPPPLPYGGVPLRRQHRRHGSGSSGASAAPSPARLSVATGAAAAVAAAASMTPPRPSRPAAAALQPWAALGRPPVWALTGPAATAAPAAGDGVGQAGGGAKKGGQLQKTKAITEARRRAARERFELPVSEDPLRDGAGAAASGNAPPDAPARVTSLDLALYGTTLTVSYDESAARVYVVGEIWSRAVKQVLGPRITRLKEALRALRPRKQGQQNADRMSAAAAIPADAAATVAGALPAAPPATDSAPSPAAAAAATRRDKPFVELVLDARRLAVVLEHQPLEAWMALHGSALRATATQRQLYERLMSGHVGSCAARDRKDVAAAVAAAGAAAAAAGIPGGGFRRFASGGIAAKSFGSLTRSSSGSSSASTNGLDGGGVGASGGRHRRVGSSSDSNSDESEVAEPVPAVTTPGRHGWLRHRRQPSQGKAAAAVATPRGTAGGAGGAGAASGLAQGVPEGAIPDASAAGGGGAADEWVQVMRDVARSYVAACRAIQSAADMASAASSSSTGASASWAPGLGAAGASASDCGPGGSALVGCPGGALLHLSLSEAQAVVVVAPAGCNRGRKVAEAAIARIDSPVSESVTFERVVAVSLAAGGSDLQASIAGCGGPSSPALTARQVAVSGWIIRARQLAATPRCTTSHWPVGRHHAAPVMTPVRFARPNMKTYTDLRIEMDALAAAFSTAMEPALAQLAKAMKQRVVPPTPQLLQPNGRVAGHQPTPQPPPMSQSTASPSSLGQGTAAAAAATLPSSSSSASSVAGRAGDGAAAAATAASPSGLPPWDNIRYVWRGGMKIMIRGLNLVAGCSSLELPLTVNDPRVALSASTFGVVIGTGRLDVTATAFALAGFARGPGRGPGEPLLTVPLVSLPLLNTSLHTAFKQRSPTPYAFPLLRQPPPPDAVQEPVDVPGLMKASSWTLAFEAALLKDAAVHLAAASAAATSSSSVATAAAGGGVSASAGAQATWRRPQPPPSQGQQSGPQGPAMSLGALAAGGGEGLPRVFLGELQIKFLIALMQGLAGGAPVMTRGSWKRRTHYDPPRPRPAPAPAIVPQPAPPQPSAQPPQQQNPKVATAQGSPPQELGASVAPPGSLQSAPAPVSNTGGAPGSGRLGSLLIRSTINVSAEVLDIAHDAQDPDDPSDLLCLRARNLRYANAFGYAPAVRTTVRSTGEVRSRVSQRPVMTALSVEAYDIRLFMPYGSAPASAGATDCQGPGGLIGSGGGLAGAGAAAVAGGVAGGGGAGKGRRQVAMPGATRLGQYPYTPAFDSSTDVGDGAADPFAGPGFGAGLIASCDCLQLCQAPPEGPPAAAATASSLLGPAQEPGQAPSHHRAPRPIRIVVKDVQVLCTTDSRDAVIATTVHIIEAFTRTPPAPPGRLQLLAATRATAAATNAAADALVSADPAGAPQPSGNPSMPLPTSTSSGLDPAGRLGMNSTSGAAGAAIGIGDKTTAVREAAGGGAVAAGARGGEDTLGVRQQLAAAASGGGGPRPLVSSVTSDPEALVEPQIDPRVIADERALVALLRQQNEARRAEARRRRLDRGSADTTASSTPAATADTDPDPDRGSMDSDSEDGDVLGRLDPSDMPDPDPDAATATDAAGVASAGGLRRGAARAAGGGGAGAGTAAGVGSASAVARQAKETQTTYEVEFVRVQVALITENNTGSGACMVLGADSAILAGGRSVAAAQKVLTFEVETLQAYAARTEALREASNAAGSATSGGGGGGPTFTRPSFSPLSDGLAAAAAASAAAATGGGSMPPRPIAGGTVTDMYGNSGVATAHASAAGSPVAWLQVVNGQLVPYGTAQATAAGATGASEYSGFGAPPSAADGGGGAAAGIDAATAGDGGPRVIMQKILNPFRISLNSSRPWVAPPSPLQLGGSLHANGDASGGGAAAATSGNDGLKLDIDVEAITGQMESWQFQLLLDVINEALASPLPKVAMLTRGSGTRPLPAVEASPEVAVTAEMLVSLKQQLRCMQYESLVLAAYLTSGAAIFADQFQLSPPPPSGSTTYAQSAAFPQPPPSQQQQQQQQSSWMLLPAGAGAAAADVACYAGVPYTAALFKPAAQGSAGVGVGRPGAAAGGGGAPAGAGVAGLGAYIPPSVMAHALLAPRHHGLSVVQQTAVLRRNQELLLHYILEQVSGAQESLEAVAGVLGRLRTEVTAALEAQQQQRRKQATAVAVRLGRFGWALLNREGAPFVQAELRGLAFHHSMDRDHTGTTKITMHAAEMWELRPGNGQGPGPQAGAGPGAATAAAAVGASLPPAPPAGAGDKSNREPGGAASAVAGIAAAVPASAGGGAAAAGATGAGSAGGSTILSLWRPDASPSWDDDPLLRMYVVHGGVDPQFVTYEHIEVYLHPLQVRLTYALAHILTDYFELRDDDRDEAAAVGGGKDDSKRDRYKGSSLAGAATGPGGCGANAGGANSSSGGGGASVPTAGVCGGAGAAAGGTQASPPKSGRSGAGWLRRRNNVATAEAAQQQQQQQQQLAGLSQGPGLTGAGPQGAASFLPAGGGSGAGHSARALMSGAGANADALPLSAHRALASGLPPSVGASPQRSLDPVAAAAAAAVAGAPAGPRGDVPHTFGSAGGQHSRTPSYADDLSSVAATAVVASAVPTPVVPPTGGAAVAAASTPAVIAVRYGPYYRRTVDGRAVILVEVSGALVPTLVSAVAQAAAGMSGAPAGRGTKSAVGGSGAAADAAGGGGGSGSGASGGGSGGRGATGRLRRRLRFRHVRFNRIAARLTYLGPRLSIGSKHGGWGFMIDARVYRNIEGGWRDILAKYKWDVIRSVIKSVAGIQSSKLKELRGAPRGGAAAAAAAAAATSGDTAAGLLASGISLDDLDPDISFAADGNALSSIAAEGGGSGADGGGTGGGAVSGSQRAAALLGGVKKRAAAFMSAGGAASARLRQAAGRPLGRTTGGGGGSLALASGGAGGGGALLPTSPEDPERDGDDGVSVTAAATGTSAAAAAGELASLEVVRQMVQQDTTQEYERIMRAAAAAQARATRLAALLGDVPAAVAVAGVGGCGGGGVSSAGNAALAAPAGGAGGRGRTYRA